MTALSSNNVARKQRLNISTENCHILLHQLSPWLFVVKSARPKDRSVLRSERFGVASSIA